MRLLQQRRLKSGRKWLLGLLLCGACVSRPPVIKKDFAYISVCIYSATRQNFDCGTERQGVWTLPASLADGYIAYPKDDHDKLMSECLK